MKAVTTSKSEEQMLLPKYIDRKVRQESECVRGSGLAEGRGPPWQLLKDICDLWCNSIHICSEFY